MWSGSVAAWLLACLLLSILTSCPWAFRARHKKRVPQADPFAAEAGESTLRVRLKSRRSKNYLHVDSNGDERKDPIVQHSSESEGSEWFYERVDGSNSTVRLRSVRSDYYLHVDSKQKQKGDPVIQHDSTGEGSQWEVSELGNSRVMLRSSRSRLYLHVDSDLKKNRDPVIQHTSTSDGSEWELEKLTGCEFDADCDANYVCQEGECKPGWYVIGGGYSTASGGNAEWSCEAGGFLRITTYQECERAADSLGIKVIKLSRASHSNWASGCSVGQGSAPLGVADGNDGQLFFSSNLSGRASASAPKLLICKAVYFLGCYTIDDANEQAPERDSSWQNRIDGCVNRAILRQSTYFGLTEPDESGRARCRISDAIDINLKLPSDEPCRSRLYNGWSHGRFREVALYSLKAPDYILHRVENCISDCARSCRGQVKLGKSWRDEQCNSITDTLSSVGQWLDGEKSQSGFGDGSRRRRRRRSRAQCIDVPEDCQVMRNKNGTGWEALWTPGHYVYDENEIFPDEGYRLQLQNLGLCNAVEEHEDLALKYTLGDPVPEWGCNCVGEDPMIWKDTSTDLFYVVEEVGSTCEEPMPSSDVLGGSDDPEPNSCHAPIQGSGKCETIEDTKERVFSNIVDFADKKSDGKPLRVLEEAILPMIRLLGVGGGGGPWGPSGGDKTNICYGNWDSTSLTRFTKSSRRRQAEAHSIGCSDPPYALDEDWSVLGFETPFPQFAKVICPLLSATSYADFKDSNASTCVSFTDCGSGRPSFAWHLNGAMAACLAGSKVIKALTGGVSYIVAEGARASVSGVGLGVSLTGHFSPTVRVYDGNQQDVTLKANAYFYLATKLPSLMPRGLGDWLDVDYKGMCSLQVGNGRRPSKMVKRMFTEGPIGLLRNLVGRVSLACTVKAEIELKLKKMGVFTKNLPFGKFDGNLLLSTQTLRDNIMPGLYFQATASGQGSIIREAFDWVWSQAFDLLENLVKPLKSIGIGGTISSFVKNVTEEIRKVARKAIPGSGGSEFAVYGNTDGLGFYMAFPINLVLIKSNKCRIRCRIRFSNFDISCGIKLKIGFPWKWIVKIFQDIGKGLQGFLSDVLNTIEDAETMIVNSFKKGYKKFVQIGEKAWANTHSLAKVAIKKTNRVIKKAKRKINKFAKKVRKGISRAFRRRRRKKIFR